MRTKPSPIVNLSSPISNTNSTNGTTIPPITLHYQNKIEGPQLSGGDRSGTTGGPTNTQQPSRRKRFENFIKSLVGRKSYTKEKELNSGTAITTTTTPTTPLQPPPLLVTPEITINPSISINDISINRDGSSSSKALGLGPPSCSTTSLNLVQQKLWNVVPVLRNHNGSSRCTGSVTDLSPRRNHQSQSLNIENHRQYNYNVGSKGLRKCETVIAFNSRQSLYEHVSGVGGCQRVAVTLGGKKTTSLANGVEQIRPLNRLRNSLSTSNATCSRCSSLLSLAGAGSRYSLNVSNHFDDSLCNIAATTNNTAIKSNNKSKLSLLNGVANATQDSGVDVDDDKNASSTFSSTSSSSSSSASPSPQPPLFTQSSTNLTVLNGGSNDHNGGATITCKLCLLDVTPDETTIIKHCGCQFCTEVS